MCVCWGDTNYDIIAVCGIARVDGMILQLMWSLVSYEHRNTGDKAVSIGREAMWVPRS